MNGLLQTVEITPDLTVDNEDAPAPGRLLVACRCPICRCSHWFALRPGRWTVQHMHGGSWTAQPLPTEAPARELVSA